MYEIIENNLNSDKLEKVFELSSLIGAIDFVKAKAKDIDVMSLAIVKNRNIVGYYNKNQGFVILKYGVKYMTDMLEVSNLYFNTKDIFSVEFNGHVSPFMNEAEALKAGFKLHEVKPQYYKEQAKNHYENKNGIDLMEYLEKEIFTSEELKVIAKFNMIKYAARAGLKEGEPAEKDMKKARDYQEVYQEHDNSFEGRYISQDVASIVSDFKEYK